MGMTRRIRHYATAMLAVVAVWQVGSLIHLATETHALRSHGLIVHVEEGHSHGDGSGHDHDTDDGHDTEHECGVLIALAAARTMISGSAPDVFPDAVDPLIASTPAIECWKSTGELYRLSPSHSPPRA